MTNEYTINISMECVDSDVFASALNAFNKALFSKGIDFESKYINPQVDISTLFKSAHTITFNENVFPLADLTGSYSVYLEDILNKSLKNIKNSDMVTIEIDGIPFKLVIPPAKPKKTIQMESANFQKGPIDRLSSHFHTNNNKKVKLENINLMKFLAKTLYDTTFKIKKIDGKIQAYDGEDEKHFIDFFENINTYLIFTSETKNLSEENRKRLIEALLSLIETFSAPPP